MKFSGYHAQSRIVEGVCVPISGGIGDYDELLSGPRRASDGHEPHAPRLDDLYERIWRLMAAYIASPEGEGEDTCT